MRGDDTSGERWRRRRGERERCAAKSRWVYAATQGFLKCICRDLMWAVHPLMNSGLDQY